MLWQRVLTAVVLLVPALAAIFLLPPAGLAVVLLLVAAQAAWEWGGLAQLGGRTGRLGYCALVVAVSSLAVIGLLRYPHWGSTPALLHLALLWWLLAFLWIVRQGRHALVPSPALRLAIGVLVIPAAILGLLVVRSAAWGAAGLLGLFLIVWAADVGAYFAGRAFGRHKLAPAVSPGKTWEGFAGGLAASVLVAAAAAAWLLHPAPQPWATWLVLAAAVAAISVVGDLTESLLKRLAGVKDSGTLLPGHGGVLDRIDSVLAAAPLMAAGLMLVGQ